MKKIIIAAGIIFLSINAPAQSQEAQQLLLNWEKLTQFKKILKDMYDAYKIIDQGYKNIKSISAGSFSLHKNFLDGMLEVSPVVKKYSRIADIINMELLLVKQCKSFCNRFKNDKIFGVNEIAYINKVYANLFTESVKNIDELFMIITSGSLRMTDDERMQGVDKIYKKIEDQFSFLQDFNTSTAYLSLQRKSENADIDMSKRISGY